MPLFVESKPGALERALVECVRRLAAAHPQYDGQAIDTAQEALCGRVPRELAEALIGDAVGLLSEIEATRDVTTVFGAVGQPALRREEFLFLSALAALQTGDLCRTLAILSDMLVDTRVGRLLFPMKFLATRLQLGGVWITPIGERAFAVFTTDLPRPRRTPGRARLKLARSAS